MSQAANSHGEDDCGKATHHHQIHHHHHNNKIASSFSPAINATLNTPELLEQILSYLPPLQLLRSKRVSHSFRNAILSSPTMRRGMSTFILAGETLDQSDLFRADGGGAVVFPVRKLEVASFFYPDDGGRRWFGRFAVDDCDGGRDGEEVWGMLRRGGASFGDLRVVDLELGDVRVGWHCGCVEGGRMEGGLARSGEDGEEGCEGTKEVRFGDVFRVLEKRHSEEGFQEGGCKGVGKFWVDGLWEGSLEFREFGR